MRLTALTLIIASACAPETRQRASDAGVGADAGAVDAGVGADAGAIDAGDDAAEWDGASTDAGGTADFCLGLLNGYWCDGDDLVYCQDDAAASRETCVHGCVQHAQGYNDECAEAPADAGAAADSGGAADAARPDVEAAVCDPGYTPPVVSADPPTEADRCTYMDWSLEVDGYYGISRFGTSEDDTTWGRGTSCGGLNLHYLTWCCQYDRHTESCIDGGTPDFLNCDADDPRLPTIPWVQGTVDYQTSTVVNSVTSYFFDVQGELRPLGDTLDFPHPEYFYVAGAQRFNCGATLRVTNPENGRCIVAYVEDGGPGLTYEQEGYCGRRILDSSPALHAFLDPSRSGWREPTKMMVEWGLPGDVPGQQCTPCQSTLAARGTEALRNSFDINQYDAPNCRALFDEAP